MKKININNIKYNFEIGKSFAGIDFGFPVKKALRLLGKPDKTYKDKLSLYFQYNNLGLYLTYEKEQKKWTDLGIQTDKLIYEGNNWYDYNKEKLLKIIETIYYKKKIDFDFDITKLDYFDEEQYNFYEIGVTLFFNKTKLTNIALSKPNYF